MAHITHITPTSPPTSGFLDKLHVYLNKIYVWIAEKIRKIAANLFFTDHLNIDPIRLQNKSQEYIHKYGAKILPTPMDALCVPAQNSATGNAVVMCFNGPYQKYKPETFWAPMRDNGADIVLWNPTQIDSLNMAQELKALLTTMRLTNPQQIIAVKAYCASSDFAIKAVAELNDPNVHLIIDRGFGEAKKLARSFFFFSNLPFVQKVLSDHFDCQGIEKIKTVQGKMLFLIAKQDQMLNLKATNLTQELYNAAPSSQRDNIFLHGDHVTPWDKDSYDKVLAFLSSLHIVKPSPNPVDSKLYPSIQLGCFRTTIIPRLIHPPC